MAAIQINMLLFLNTPPPIASPLVHAGFRDTYVKMEGWQRAEPTVVDVGGRICFLIRGWTMINWICT